jgi:hypothetical protein
MGNRWWVGFDEPGDPTVGDADAVAAGIFAAYAAHVLPYHSTAFSLLSVDAHLFGSSGEVIGGFAAPTPGLESGTGAQTMAAVVASWRDGQAYRGGKPRTYLGGIPESARSTTYTWNDTYLNALSGGLADFLNTVNALAPSPITGLKLGCLHRWRAGVALSPPVFAGFTGVRTQKRVCTQRLRLGSEIPG